MTTPIPDTWIAVVCLVVVIIVQHIQLELASAAIVRGAATMDDHDKRLEALEEEHETASEKREDW